jgi:hypothetical protein
MLRKPVGFLPRYIQLSSRRTAKYFSSLVTVNRGCLLSPLNVTLRSIYLKSQNLSPSTAGHFHISLTHSKLFDDTLLRGRLGGKKVEIFVSLLPVCDLWTKSYFPAFSFCHNSIPRKLFMSDNYFLL